MKKFTFLLALVAVLAMSAAAWAGDPTGVKELRTVNKTMSTQVNGKIAADSAPGSDGDYCTKLYHIGSAAPADSGTICFDIDLHEGANGVYLKAVPASGGYGGIDNITVQNGQTEYTNAAFSIPSPITTTTQYTIGLGPRDDATLLPIPDKKSLDVIPVKVEFDSTIEVSVKAGSTASLNIKKDFDDGNPGVQLATLGEYGSDQDYVISYVDGDAAKSLTPGTAAVVGGLSLTYDPDTHTLTVKSDRPTPPASGTKVALTIAATSFGEVKIDEDGGLEKILVAGIDAGDAIGTITIDVIGGGSVDPLIELTEVLNETTNEAISKEIGSALEGGIERFMLIMSGDREVAGIASNDFEMAPITSTDRTIGVKVAFLKRAESGAIEKSDTAPETVRVELIGDRLGKSTANFDVSSNGDTVQPDTRLIVDNGVVAFSVNTRADTRDDDYTLNVLDGGILTPAAVDAKVIGDVVASQKFRVSQETHNSSGGACDAGAGLAAAGLAAVALRRRGKQQ